eukprot:scaffold34611_cov184-Amphora_coffeaeformis.AAC.11
MSVESCQFASFTIQIENGAKATSTVSDVGEAVVGVGLGAAVGLSVGLDEGVVDGATVEGAGVGSTDGDRVGFTVDLAVGKGVGGRVGLPVMGARVGSGVGTVASFSISSASGGCLSLMISFPTGARVGRKVVPDDGCGVGDEVGSSTCSDSKMELVGTAVGAEVCSLVVGAVVQVSKQEVRSNMSLLSNAWT